MQLRCNMWVSRSRPKRMPKDEIPVCNCRPVVQQSTLQQRPPSATPPLSPTKRQSVMLLAADLACNKLPRPGSASPAVSPPLTADHSVAALPSLPLPLLSSSEVLKVGPIPEPDVATDLATAPAAQPAAALAPGWQPEEAQLPMPAQLQPLPAAPASPPRSATALLEAPSAPAPMQSLRTGCGENCLNRLSYIHCDPRSCPCALQCSNR